MRSEIKFNNELKLLNLTKIIFNGDDKVKYDKNLNKCYFKPFSDNLKCAGFEYTNYKKHYPVSSRDFYEKVFKFHYNNKYYKYACSVVDSDKGENAAKPGEPETIRGFNFLNFSVVQMKGDS